MNFRASLAAAVVLVIACRLAASVTVTNYTWSGTISGDTGNASNWAGNAVPVNDSANTSLTFGPSTFGTATQTNLTLSSSFVVNSITFTSSAPHYYFGSTGGSLGIGSGGVTLQGSTSSFIDVSSGLNVSLLANQTWSTGGNLSVYGDISGAFSLTKTGTGYLALGGNNTFSGGVTVSTGTLYLTSNSTKSGATITSGPVGTGTLTLTNGTTLSPLLSAVTLDNPLSLSGNVIFGAAGSPTLTLTGAASLANNSATIGTFSRVTLNGTLTTASEGNLNFNFGGGNGTIVVASNLSNPALGGTSSLNVVSSLTDESLHLTVFLQGANTFTGGVTSTASSVVFDGPTALPSGVKFVLGDDGYVGYTENATNISNFGAFLTKVTSVSGSSHNGDTIIGIDSHTTNTANPRVVSDAIDLSVTTPFVLGTATSVALSGTITPPTSTHRLDVTGVNGGYLKIISPLTVANGITSGLHIGSSENEVGDVSYKGYVELTNGSSDYTGGTLLQSGYLLVGANSTFASGNVTSGPLGTGTLTVNGTADTGAPALAASVNGITLNNNISINVSSGNNTTSDNKLLVGVPITSATTDFAFPLQSFKSNSLTLAGIISGSGALDYEGTGTLTLTGNNTYTGATTIAAGTLSIGAGGTTGAIAGNITNNSALTFARSNAYTYAGVISGTGQVNQIGTGTLTLSGASTYSGITNINTGTLALGAANVLPAAGTVSIGPGALFDVKFDQTVGGLTGPGTSAVAITNTKTLTLNAAAAGIQFDGVISGSGALTKTGTNIVTLTGNNTLTGTTTISAGTLQLGTGGTAGGVSGDIVNNGSVVFNRSDSVTYAGVISGTGNGTKLGAGTLTLAGANTYTGATTISGGTLLLGVNNALPSSTAVNLSTAGVKLDVNGFTDTVTSLAGVTGTEISLGNGALTTSGSSSTTFAGTITGNGGSLIKSGSGTLTLSSAETYTGGTTVNNGTLNVAGSLAAAGDVTVNGGGNFQLGNPATQTIRALSGNGTVTLASGSTLAPNLPATGAGSTSTFSGTITGGGSFAKTGLGTLTLSGSGSYTGTTTVSSGTLVIGGTNALPTATQLALANGSTMQVSANQTIASFLGNTTGSNLLIDANQVLTVAMPVANTFTNYSGSIALGAGTGTGTFAVTGATGGGDIAFLANAPGAGITTTHDANSTIVVGTAAIPLPANGALQFSGNTTQTLNNVISGSNVTLVFSAGNTSFTAANTYSGTTAVTGGKFIVNNVSGSATGTGAVTVTNGGTLGGSGFISGPLTLGSGGTVSPGNSPGILSVGSTTFAGGATFAFDLNSATGVPGTNWDLLQITGGLTITATSGNPFIINLTSLDNTNLAGLAQNFNSSQAYSWQFLSTTTGITGFTSPAVFSFNTTNFQNSLGIGSFFVSQSGNNLFLNFTPVPEPSTWALLATGLGTLALAAVRRRRS